MQEFQIISEIFSPLTNDFQGSYGLKDDCAVIPKDDKTDYVISKDAIVENIHFFEDSMAESIAQRLLVSNLSDIASVGAIPKFYFLAGSINQTTNEKWLKSFAKRLEIINKQYDVTLLGGDTFKSPNDLFFSCTIIGEVKKGKAILRKTAKLGDDIYVSGVIGESYLGYRILKGELEELSYPDKNHLINSFLYPDARVPLGAQLQGVASASTDVSDGLIADLENICEASNVSASINIEDIPIAYRDEYALDQITFGDDYELVFTAPKKNADKIKKISEKLDLPITKIGSIEKSKEGDKVSLFDKKNKEIELTSKGYEH